MVLLVLETASLTALCGGLWDEQCFPYGSFVDSFPAHDAGEALSGAAPAAPLGGKSEKL